MRGCDAAVRPGRRGRADVANVADSAAFDAQAPRKGKVLRRARKGQLPRPAAVALLPPCGVVAADCQGRQPAVLASPPS
eukprot:scaffold106720_cov62-Phaeocystis_antarctica.AAC.6